MEETEWEVVGEDLDRQQVPGGWVYRTISTYAHGDAVAVALVFVPDAAQGENKKKIRLTKVRR